MDVVIIGAGNLAFHLAPELKEAGFNVSQVYSRTLNAARDLALKIGAEFTNDINRIQKKADVYIIALSDQAALWFIENFEFNDALFIHTSGGLAIDVFKDKAKRYGVLYPLQTFSKSRPLEFNTIPLCIEGSDETVEDAIYAMARQISGVVRRINTKNRQYLHLAAVYACNFTNHLYTIADSILNEVDLEFDLLKPLVMETANKVLFFKPYQIQTGPAVRNDTNILKKHMDLLSFNSVYRTIYKDLTQSIQSRENNN